MRCGIAKSIDAFRLRRRGHSERACDCSRCHAQREAARRKAKREIRRNRRLATVAREIVRSEPNRIPILADRLLADFNGPVGTARRLAEVVRRRPESTVSANILLATMRLKAYCESQPVEPLNAVVDKRQELAREMIGWTLENPELAIECLRELGYVVVSPAEGRD